MSKVRLNSAEAARIQEVADRFAKRTSRRYEMDTQRVEVVDSDEGGQPQAQDEQGEEGTPDEVQFR